jgi:hypothetical protein
MDGSTLTRSPLHEGEDNGSDRCSAPSESGCATGAPPAAISEDLLSQIEEALAVYRVACDDYLDGHAGAGAVGRRHYELETLCLKAGMGLSDDPEAFAARVSS